MRMIFLFIDGFGLGESDTSKNPIFAANTPNLDHIFENYLVMPTDAALGIPGLPQSATGQTSIFTGVNAPAVLGRHLHGQPTVTLKGIIHRNNLFKELLKRNLTVTNANVYRHEYLEKMLDARDRKHRPSVTSVMTMSAGIKFRTVEDYINCEGVYHDITGQILQDSGYDIGPVTAREAAKRVYTLSRNYDFTLFEHFMTDIIGHKMEMEPAVKEIELLDEFLGGLLELVDLDNDMIVIASDHGNIEDISVKTHTLNKVPTIFIGRVPAGVDVEVSALPDIMPAVLRVFDRWR